MSNDVKVSVVAEPVLMSHEQSRSPEYSPSEPSVTSPEEPVSVWRPEHTPPEEEGTGAGLLSVGEGVTASTGLLVASVGLGVASVGLGVASVGLGVASVGLGVASVGLGVASVGLGVASVGF
jgi:hypothetical protein